MRIAHIIMTFKNPAQLEMMIKAMDHPKFYFFIHLDLKIDIQPFLYLSNFERVIFIQDRQLINWGGYSFVKGILASLNEVLNKNLEFDFYNLLSGQDYPIKPVNIIANFYESNLGKSFVSYDPEDKMDWWAHAVTRYEDYHFTDLKFRGKYLLQRIVNFIAPKRKFPMPLKLYGSNVSSWWTISNDCAKYLVKFMDGNVKLAKYMKYTWGSDEFLIATILMNSSFKDQIINDNLRYITWTNTSPNPLILTAENLPAILSSDKLFARKFDLDVDNNILIEIDKCLNNS